MCLSWSSRGVTVLIGPAQVRGCARLAELSRGNSGALQKWVKSVRGGFASGRKAESKVCPCAMSEGDGSQTLGHARVPARIGAWSRLDGYITPVGFCGWKAHQEGGELEHHFCVQPARGEARSPEGEGGQALAKRGHKMWPEAKAGRSPRIFPINSNLRRPQTFSTWNY